MGNFKAKNRILISWLLFLLPPACQQKGEDSIRLIPQGFKGPIVIIYNQKDGAPIEYEKGKRVYRIPSSGLLKTQFMPNYGYQQHDFYYVDCLGNRSEIPFFFPWNLEQVDTTSNAFIAFGEEVIGTTKKFNLDRSISYIKPPGRVFLIGKINDQDSLQNLKSSFVSQSYRDF